MSHVVDLTGTDFGYLHVIGRDTSKKGDTAHWICRCKCGTVCSKDGKYLRNGHAKSCGCFRKERAATLVTKKNPAKKPKAEPKKKKSAAARSGQAPGSATTHSARRATTTAAPGAAPSAASARNANLPASRGGRSSQFEGSIKMAEIMGAFAHDLDNFVAYYEKQQWDTSFRGEQYPPRIVMEQSTPPLFEVGTDGAKTLVPNPTIQIIGRPETEVVTTGKLQISKKDFTNLTNRAAALLELFLHGFMQERKEMEAAQND